MEIKGNHIIRKAREVGHSSYYFPSSKTEPKYLQESVLHRAYRAGYDKGQQSAFDNIEQSITKCYEYIDESIVDLWKKVHELGAHCHHVAIKENDTLSYDILFVVDHPFYYSEKINILFKHSRNYRIQAINISPDIFMDFDIIPFDESFSIEQVTPVQNV